VDSAARLGAASLHAPAGSGEGYKAKNDLIRYLAERLRAHLLVHCQTATAIVGSTGYTRYWIVQIAKRGSHAKAQQM
jgi:hypothetical protein